MRNGTIFTRSLSFYICIYILVFAAVVPGSSGNQKCIKHQECSIGTLRDELLAHTGTALEHNLVGVLLRHNFHPDCPDPELESKKQELLADHAEHVNKHPSQCLTAFSFTFAEAFVAHLLLVINVAIGTAWIDNSI